MSDYVPTTPQLPKENQNAPTETRDIDAGDANGDVKPQGSHEGGGQAQSQWRTAAHADAGAGRRSPTPQREELQPPSSVDRQGEPATSALAALMVPEGETSPLDLTEQTAEVSATATRRLRSDTARGRNNLTSGEDLGAPAPTLEGSGRQEPMKVEASKKLKPRKKRTAEATADVPGGAEPLEGAELTRSGAPPLSETRKRRRVDGEAGEEEGPSTRDIVQAAPTRTDNTPSAQGPTGPEGAGNFCWPTPREANDIFGSHPSMAKATKAKPVARLAKDKRKGARRSRDATSAARDQSIPEAAGTSGEQTVGPPVEDRSATAQPPTEAASIPLNTGFVRASTLPRDSLVSNHSWPTEAASVPRLHATQRHTATPPPLEAQHLRAPTPEITAGLYAVDVENEDEPMTVDAPPVQPQPLPATHPPTRRAHAPTQFPLPSTAHTAGLRRSPTANPPMRNIRAPTPLTRIPRFSRTHTPDNAREGSSRLTAVVPASIRLRAARPARDLSDEEVLFDKCRAGSPPAPPPAPQRTATAACPQPAQYVLTRRPRAGWREIAQRDFHSRREGQAPFQAAAWGNDTRDAIILYFPGHGAQDAGTEDRIAAAQDIMFTRFGVMNTNDLEIIPAIPTTPGARAANTAPYGIAVFGLDPEVGRQIVEDGWISAATVTFRAEHIEASPPRYQGAFMYPRRFGGISPAVIAARIRRTIRDGGRNEEEVRTYIANDIEDGGRWSHLDESTVFDHIVDQIQVRVIPYQVRGGASEPLALVYIESPTANANEWDAFRAFIMSLDYGDDLTGHPVPFAGTMWCSLCHSHDHPTGLCDLPSIPGWNGPTQEYHTLRGSAARRQERRPDSKDKKGKSRDDGRDESQDKRRRDFDGKGGRRGGPPSSGAGSTSARRFT